MEIWRKVMAIVNLTLKLKIEKMFLLDKDVPIPANGKQTYDIPEKEHNTTHPYNPSEQILNQSYFKCGGIIIQ